MPWGAVFSLDTSTPYAYLHHCSELGEFWLSSDAVIPTVMENLRAVWYDRQRPAREDFVPGTSWIIRV